ncbi:hypothetical protein XELAEV_18046190mg [Xenopus laevis]|uniref:Uncharacterized protein n=1 Tax=Xenopus laevis TaxID=8355 RepID=A0A974BT73_XENLA|nr:hypothetical protein XELAEV_18046190mg [Xenopus laevis]
MMERSSGLRRMRSRYRIPSVVAVKHEPTNCQHLPLLNIDMMKNQTKCGGPTNIARLHIPEGFLNGGTGLV